LSIETLHLVRPFDTLRVPRRIEGQAHHPEAHRWVVQGDSGGDLFNILLGREDIVMSPEETGSILVVDDDAEMRVRIGAVCS